MVKIFEFILLIVCVCIAGLAFAGNMTTATGHGYYTYNGQVIGYFNLPAGTYPINTGVTATDTSDVPVISINQTASCQYTQSFNPSINMNC